MQITYKRNGDYLPGDPRLKFKNAEKFYKYMDKKHARRSKIVSPVLRRRKCPHCGMFMWVDDEICASCDKYSKSPNCSWSYRLAAASAYLLFFLPLIFKPKNDFTRFHANQGLLAFFGSLGILSLFPLYFLICIYLAGFFFLLFLAPVVHTTIGVLYVIHLVFVFKNICSALRGGYRTLPKIGKYRIIKSETGY